jgi:hypothetical protein
VEPQEVFPQLLIVFIVVLFAITVTEMTVVVIAPEMPIQVVLVIEPLVAVSTNGMAFEATVVLVAFSLVTCQIFSVVAFSLVREQL